MQTDLRLDWRCHVLDGAVLWFQPRTGLHVRLDGPETKDFRRVAPRVVMFGITNRCNLSCDFCSRDVAAHSSWSVDSAFEVLADLSRAGVLEVAFGGGEPFAFRGFDDLICRLGEETPLVLNVTTNGALLTRARVERIAPFIGEIRVSLYDETPWRDALILLDTSQCRFGANVLVTPKRVPLLPGLLRELAELGCSDVALLSYVGPDRRLHLSRRDEVTLHEIVASSPLPAKLSVCFGDRLDPVERLFSGDCGAGRDFAVLTSDKKLKSCSFHHESVAVESAQDFLAAWSSKRQQLALPAASPGCARTSGVESIEPMGIRIWQGFSGNNSGACILVGRFETGEAAERYIRDLLPGFSREREYSADWRALLEGAGIKVQKGEYSPDELAFAGRTVMAYTNSALEDDFPSLRTLLWRQGGRSVYSGIHEHEAVALASGLRFSNAERLEKAQWEIETVGLGKFERRGLDLLGFVPISRLRDRPMSLSTQVDALELLASRTESHMSAEIMPVDLECNLPTALAARSDEGREWLWVRFASEKAAQAFSKKIKGNVTWVHQWVLVEGGTIGARLGLLAQRSGGTAQVLVGGSLRLVLTFFRREKVKVRGATSHALPVDLEETRATLVPTLRPAVSARESITLFSDHRNVVCEVVTENPQGALQVAASYADSRNYGLWAEAGPRDRIAAAFSRIASDLELSRRR